MKRRYIDHNLRPLKPNEISGIEGEAPRGQDRIYNGDPTPELPGPVMPVMDKMGENESDFDPMTLAAAGQALGGMLGAVGIKVGAGQDQIAQQQLAAYQVKQNAALNAKKMVIWAIAAVAVIGLAVLVYAMKRK